MNVGARAAVVALLLVFAPPAYGQVTYTDVSASAGILTSTGELGSGVAAEDFDQDGDIDLFVPRRANVADRLYRNLGNGSYQEIAAAAGLSDNQLTKLGLWLDYDGDHKLDLLTVSDCFGGSAAFCATFRTTKLYRQVSDAVFVEVTGAAGLEGAIPANSSRVAGGAAAGDVNGDGYVDLFIATWSSLGSGNLEGSKLLLNTGSGGFVDATAAAGLVLGEDRHWQPVMADLNGDGLLDIYSAVDIGPNRMWINQGDGTFVDAAPAANADNAWNNMGVALGDPDNDGDFDIYVTNIENSPPTRWSILLENVSAGGVLSYNEIARSSGLIGGVWGWGTSWLDVDNDGWLDLAHTNGSFTGPDQSRLYYNTGTAPLSFTDISTSAGFNDTLWGSGLIAFDRDRDGDLDLFQTTRAGGSSPGRLLNNTPAVATNHYLVVKPRMSGANHWAIGAVVHVSAGGRNMMRPIMAGGSYLSQEPAEAHFGLGPATVASVSIDWPDGTQTQIADVAADQVLTVTPTTGQDSDSDGLLDDDEVVAGTNPADADSDDDGVSDGLEVGSPGAPTDTDGDATIDALDTDDDGDGVATALEDSNGNGNPADDDSDGDGIPDYLETDADADGFGDNADNCRSVANPSQADVNGDGIGDACQPGDSDLDGWPDSADNCRNSANADQLDADGDSVGNVCDNCPTVSNPGQADSDSDGTGDACEIDGDGDGVVDDVDNCSVVANAGQENADGDAFGDACDLCPADAANDVDADGLCANADNCPVVANVDQADADGDALGDLCDACPNDSANDADGDGVCANADNCPTAANPGQADADGDGIGDVCEADSDGDGVVDDGDNCRFRVNPGQENANGDAAGDACQCGDLTGDNLPDAADITAIRDHLTGLVPLSAGQLERCSVHGGDASCDVADVAVLTRDSQPISLGPGISFDCTAYIGP